MVRDAPLTRPGDAMPQRIRLKEAAFIGNHRYEAGEIVTLADGVKGPHRAMRRSHDKIDYGTNPPIDANRQVGELEDVPLYDVVKEDGP